MLDKVKPLKFESDELDFGPTETQPSEDHLNAKGIVFEDNDSVHIDKDASHNMVFFDGVSGGPHPLSDLLSSAGGGITEPEHEALDTGVHLLSESCYEDRTYSGWKCTNVTWWTNSGKTIKVREATYNYTGWKVTSLVFQQYDGAGTEITAKKLTGTLTYTGWKCDYITWVKG